MLPRNNPKEEERPHEIVVEDNETNESKGIGPADRSGGGVTEIGTSKDDNTISEWRKDMFGDCALIEIIHLHECLRGALKALERDVEILSQSILKKKKSDELTKLERRVAGRFKVIWSVFRAHSSAEDEFIWPALRCKTKGAIKGSPKYTPHEKEPAPNPSYLPLASSSDPPTANPIEGVPTCSLPQASCRGVPHSLKSARSGDSTDNDMIEQEEYEEDHADEERMFSMMDELLSKLRNGLLQQRTDHQAAPVVPLESCADSSTSSDSIDDTMQELDTLTKQLTRHLTQHLEKEEVQCMPLVLKHLSKAEIYELVGKIMGKRSSDTIAQIMTMAVQNLSDKDREEMVLYMKQAMAGTFFDRWLSMSGWMEDTVPNSSTSVPAPRGERKRSSSLAELSATNIQSLPKQARKDENLDVNQKCPAETPASPSLGGSDAAAQDPSSGITTTAELEKHIRAIATNQNLTDVQKNITIQGLRDSVWKSNQRIMEKNLNVASGRPDVVSDYAFNPYQCHPTGANQDSGGTAVSTVFTVRRDTPPSIYFRKDDDGKIDQILPSKKSDNVPLFSSTELAPTYHDGARRSVLGCPHYARACKLRHPKSGRLYTCRLCCEQNREIPLKDQDNSIDRYAVKEVMCMKCNALQPVDDRCLNPSCESQGKPFAKYYCKICHLYDDRPRPIFHCPFCNTCRMGLGMGIDFFHCMRCNACVSMKEKEHRCIPQKLQGSCPICHESMFQSTEPLRGIQCGHVMHLSCFVQYRRGQQYTCPLCKRSMEDMSDYFALLDAAVRMQPMPTAYLSTVSNIICQDCDKTGQCQYHFVGLKCPHCGSYNTRDLSHVDIAAGSS